MTVFLRLCTLCLLLWSVTTGIAQTQPNPPVVITSVSPGSVCAGGRITIAFSNNETGSISVYVYSSNTDSTQLLPDINLGSGNFTQTRTIPADQQTGAYRIGLKRTWTNKPTYVSQKSAAFTINALPPAPTVSDVSYCVGAQAVPLTATTQSGGTAKWYRAATGGTALSTVTPSTSATGVTPYYVSQTVNTCEGPRAPQSVTVTAKPSKPVTTPVIVCQNAAPPTLASAVTAGGTLKWYTAQTGGSALSAAPTPATSTTGTVTYYVSQTNGTGCESDRTALSVQVKAQPAKPSVGAASVTYCQNATAALLSATATTGTLNWYGPTGTTLPAAPRPPTTSPGTFSYAVSQTANGCESERVTLTVTINAKPAPPTTTPLQACQNTTPPALASAVTANGTLTWYTAQTGGTALAAAPTLSTSAVGSTSYYVSQTVNGCESDRAAITFQVTALPAAPAVSTSPVAYCQGATAAPLSATAVANATLNWYTAATGGTGTSSLTPTTTASNRYYVSQTVGSCEGPRASINVTINALPPAPAVTTPVAYCQLTTAAPLSATASANNTLYWYGTNASGGTGSTTRPTPSTTDAGPFSYYVAQRDQVGCESVRTAISVTINARPAAPTVTPLRACRNAAPPSVTSAVAASGTLKWYTALTGGTALSATPALSTSAVGASTYYVSQTNASGCESDRVAVLFTVTAPPAAPVASTRSLSYCQGVTPSSLTATATGTLKWYTQRDGGTPSATLVPNTANAGLTTYYVSQTDGNGCESLRDSVTVRVNAKPASPAVAASPAYCAGATASALSATALSGNRLNWYGTNATGGTASSVAVTPSTSTTGTTAYYVSQTDGIGCESDRVAIAVQVKAKPSPPGTAPITACTNQATSLTATFANGGTPNWYGTNATGGTPSATAPIPATTVTGTPTLYYVSQTVNGCESNRASIAVTVRTPPAAPAVNSAPIVYCQGGAATALSATAVTGGSLNWYTTATGGNALASAPVPQTSTNNPPTTYYYVSQTTSGCEGPRATIAVTINARPSAPTVVSSLTACQNTSPVALTATAAGTLNWYEEAVGGSPVPRPTVSTASPDVITYYVSQTDANGCASNRASITVTITAPPEAPTVDANPILLCQNGKSTSLTATAEPGGVLNWYTAQTGGTRASVAPTPPTSVVGSATYYVSQSINGCEGPRTSLTVTVNPLPPAPSVSANSISICQNSLATELTATPVSGGTLNWYATATGGNAFPTTPMPPTTNVGATVYYVSETNANGCESNRASITVTVRAQPVAPATTPVTVCQDAASPALASGVSATGPLRWYTTQAEGEPSLVPPTPSTSDAGIIPYYVSQTDATGCESSRSPLVLTINPTPGAPAVATLAPLCQNADPVVLSAAGQNLRWYANETSPRDLGSSITQSTDRPGTFTYYVSQTISGCESDRTLVEVIINPLPPAPTVTNLNVCQGAQVETLTASGDNLQWFDANDNQIAPPTPETDVKIDQTYTYQVNQTVDGCTSPKVKLTYTVSVTPPPTVTAPLVAYCQNAVAKPLQATGTELTWTDPFGNITTGAPTPPTDAVTAGDVYLVTQIRAGCESKPAEVTVVVNGLPTATLEGEATVNLGSSAVLTLTLTGSGPYSYTLSDGTSGTVAAGSVSGDTIHNITVTPGTTTQYMVTSVANACGLGTVSEDSVTVTVDIPTVTTDLLDTEIICPGEDITVPFTTTGEFVAGNTFTVEIGSAIVDSASRRYIPISSAVASGTSITTTIPPTIAKGLYYIRVSASNSRFPIAGTPSSTLLTVRPLPTVAFTVSSKAIYKGQNAELRFALTGEPPWTVMYEAGSETKTATSTTNLFSLSVTPDTTTLYRLTSVLNGCGLGSVEGVDTASIRVDLLLAELDPFLYTVKAYPVPTEGAVTVDIDLPLQKQAAQLRLSRLDGQVIEQRTTRQRQNTFYLDREAAGTYLLYIKIGDRSTVRRLLKR